MVHSEGQQSFSAFRHRLGGLRSTQAWKVCAGAMAAMHQMQHACLVTQFHPVHIPLAIFCMGWKACQVQAGL